MFDSIEEALIEAETFLQDGLKAIPDVTYLNERHASSLSQNLPVVRYSRNRIRRVEPNTEELSNAPRVYDCLLEFTLEVGVQGVRRNLDELCKLFKRAAFSVTDSPQPSSVNGMQWIDTQYDEVEEGIRAHFAQMTFQVTIRAKEGVTIETGGLDPTNHIMTVVVDDVEEDLDKNAQSDMDQMTEENIPVPNIPNSPDNFIDPANGIPMMMTGTGGD